MARIAYHLIIHLLVCGFKEVAQHFIEATDCGHTTITIITTV
jgi:hypothetical protein